LIFNKLPEEKVKRTSVILIGLWVVLLTFGWAFGQSVNPNDLKKYDPKPPKLQNAPPPLPNREPKPESPVDKLKDKVRELEPKPGRGSAPPRAEAEPTLLLAGTRERCEEK
jgi:hypothetical protein